MKDVDGLDAYWIVEIQLPNCKRWDFHCMRKTEEEANKEKDKHDAKWGAGSPTDKEFKQGGCKSRIVECTRRVKK